MAETLISMWSTQMVAREKSLSRVPAWMSILNSLPMVRWLPLSQGGLEIPHIFKLGSQLEPVNQELSQTVGSFYAGWYNSTPAWSPTSDKIIFGGYDKDIDRYDIFIMNPDGTQLERLTLKTGDNVNSSLVSKWQRLFSNLIEWETAMLKESRLCLL